MFGAIIGDLAGSIYEYEQIKKVKPVNAINLIEKDAFISDDTILTIAILNATLTDKNYERSLKYFGQKYRGVMPNHKPYFKTIFSPGFEKWLDGNFQGNSLGNGAMMRISPIGYLFNKEDEIIENAKLATIPSHNSPEAIDCATTVALVIYYSRLGLSKNEIIEKLHLDIKDMEINNFNFTCKDTIDVCLFSLFSSNSFEESLRKVISYGGDTDTNACIVGSMAEAMFGIPDNLKQQALKFLPDEFIKILNMGYKAIVPLQTDDYMRIQ